MKKATIVYIVFILIGLSCTASKCLSKPFVTEYYIVTITDQSDMEIDNTRVGRMIGEQLAWVDYDSTQFDKYICLNDGNFDIRHQLRIKEQVVIDTTIHYDEIPEGSPNIHINLILQPNGELKIERSDN